MFPKLFDVTGVRHSAALCFHLKTSGGNFFLLSFWMLHVESSEPSGTTQPLLWVIRLLMCNLDDHLCTIYVPYINKFEMLHLIYLASEGTHKHRLYKHIINNTTI
eukprot:jgi/Chrzof1/5531/Cz16g06160.t1